jgi:hypothetical protein
MAQPSGTRIGSDSLGEGLRFIYYVDQIAPVNGDSLTAGKYVSTALNPRLDRSRVVTGNELACCRRHRQHVERQQGIDVPRTMDSFTLRSSLA